MIGALVAIVFSVLGMGLAMLVVVVHVAAGCCFWLATTLRGWADAIDRWVASL